MDEPNTSTHKLTLNSAIKYGSGIGRPLSQLNGVPCMAPSSNSCYLSPGVSKSNVCQTIQEDAENSEGACLKNSKESSVAFCYYPKTTPLAKHLSGGTFFDGSTNNGILCKQGRSTPSPLSSNKSFLTPLSSKSYRHLEHVPASHSKCMASGITNPFEECPHILQMPTVSPTLFKQVVSPSEKVDENFWSIEQMALLHPVPIETSPFQQSHVSSDPEYERRAQEAIDRYFGSTSVVPSPWTNNSHSLNIMSALLSSKASSHFQTSCASPALASPCVDIVPIKKSKDSFTDTHNASCQTDLTLPPILPKEVELVISKYCTFNQDQNLPTLDEKDENSNLNVSSLRRKLTFETKDPNGSLVQSDTKPQSTSGLSVPSEAHSPSSVASVGALPLDGDESPKIQWGTSMIRRSSGKIRRPFQNYSFTPDASSSSQSNPSGSTPTHCAFSDSPICYLKPDQRIYFSPCSEGHKSSPLRIMSPNVSPIQCPTSSPINESTFSHVQVPLHGAVDSSYHQCEASMENSPNSGQSKYPSITICPCEDVLYTPPQSNADFTRNASLATVALDGTQNTGIYSELVKHTKDVMTHVTPSFKTNHSPQFSSSPIHHGSASGKGSLQEYSPFIWKIMSPTSPPIKFSSSPPLSPIAWKGSPQEKFQINRNDMWVNANDGSGCIFNRQIPFKLTHKCCDKSLSGEWISPSKPQTSLSSRILFTENEVEKDVTMVGLSQEDHKRSRVTLFNPDMEIDSQPFLEGSACDEASNIHDTGYQTGSINLQTTL